MSLLSFVSRLECLSLFIFFFYRSMINTHFVPNQFKSQRKYDVNLANNMAIISDIAPRHTNFNRVLIQPYFGKRMLLAVCWLAISQSSVLHPRTHLGAIQLPACMQTMSPRLMSTTCWFVTPTASPACQHKKHWTRGTYFCTPNSRIYLCQCNLAGRRPQMRESPAG